MVTRIVMLRHGQLCRYSIYVQLLQIGVATHFLCRDNISVGSCCNNVSCIVSISVATRKVLSPLNLVSCCSFILILRHSLLVLSMFFVATKFLCRGKNFCFQLIFMSQPSSVMSRQDLSSLCWNICCDMEKYVVTLFINAQLIFVS